MTKLQWRQLSLAGKALTAATVTLLSTLFLALTVFAAASAVRGICWMFLG